MNDPNEQPLSISPPPPPPPTPPPPSTSVSDHNLRRIDISDTQSDFNQWLHAMKMVARLPGGMPSDFRKKLWLALSDRYIHTKGINWNEEGEKYLGEQWDEDDDELGIQIVKDLHRTGSSLCSGPSGTINQAKLKRVLLGFSRFNPEVGYCQGFNMLGALILQVMDVNEADSVKVMILLIEGLLPSGYFCGSLGGLQADMAVFRDLLSTKLPKLSRHLQKLQGPEGAFEPPLTNVFTMQWFLTLFCTCLPIPSVLRIWDLILIEGSDVLLRAALAIWGILEGQILATKTADDFYCKMGALSTELVNGNLIDCNVLIQRIVDIGPITDLQKLREKHLHYITQLKESSNLRILYSDDDGESDEDSRLVVTATAWGLRSGRRASLNLPINARNSSDGKERINLDISLLKKQYDKIRERQRQAHIILTAAVARQPQTNPSGSSFQVNQLLVGKNALLSNKGKRLGPPQGAIPPLRGSKAIKQSKSPKPTETLHWKDMDDKQNKNNFKKEIQQDMKKLCSQDDSSMHKPASPKLVKSNSASSAISNQSENVSSTGVVAKLRSDSSSYSEESDDDSSTSTSLCDDENHLMSTSSLEASPMKRRLTPDSVREVPDKAPSSEDKYCLESPLPKRDDTGTCNLSDIVNKPANHGLSIPVMTSVGKSLGMQLPSDILEAYNQQPVVAVKSTDDESLSIVITSTSQLSPIPDISHYVNISTISPLKTPSSIIDYSDYLNNISGKATVTCDAPVTDAKDNSLFNVNEDGVINQLFERINAAERPNRLDLNEIGKDSESLDNTTESVLDRNDNTSKRVDISNRSSKPSCFLLDMPTRASLQHDSPIIVSEANLVAIEKLPVIQKSSHKSTITISPNGHFEDANEICTYRMKFLQEKSFSMDDPIKENDMNPEDIARRSASAGLVSEEINDQKSSKMSEIIKENSLILRRIVRKKSQHKDMLENSASQLEQNLFRQVDEFIDNEGYLTYSDPIPSRQELSSCKTSPIIESVGLTNAIVNSQEICGEETQMTSESKFQNNTFEPVSEMPCLVDTLEQINREKVKTAIEDLKLNMAAKNTYECKLTIVENTVLGNPPIPTETKITMNSMSEQNDPLNESSHRYYVRTENFCEVVTPEEEKSQPIVLVAEPKNDSNSKVDHFGKNKKYTSQEPRAVLKTSSDELPFASKPNDEPKNQTKIGEKITDSPVITPYKTDELIRKTEEQLARFQTPDRFPLENIEKRLSLIDFKVNEAPATSTRKSSSKTEEAIKKSEEQISRIRIESTFITRKSPTHFTLNDTIIGDIKLGSCSTKTEEIIKKTDEQLARFKAAAESNAEKRKSRHEIDVLLQNKTEPSDLSNTSLESLKFDDQNINNAAVIKHEQGGNLSIQLPEEVRTSKTGEIIKRIEDGKLMLGDDYITTIKTIDYLKQSNASLSATLSSIETSIRAIDGFCDHNSDIQSNRINDTIDNLEKSLKQFDQELSDPPLVMVHDYSNLPHESRCRPTSSNRPSRSRKRREYSPRQKKEKDHDDVRNFNLHKDHNSSSETQQDEYSKSYTFHSYYSISPPISPRLVSPVEVNPRTIEISRPSTFKSTSHDRCFVQRESIPGLLKFDKSPSSPIINKSCLESLKPATPVASGRITRSAENSPPLNHQLTTMFYPLGSRSATIMNAASSVSATSSTLDGLSPNHGGLLKCQTTAHDGTERLHIRSCENIVIKLDYKNISAIAASYPVSSGALSPSPTKFYSLDFKQDATLNLSLKKS